MLNGSFPIREEEQLVPEDRPTQVAAVLAALIRRGDCRWSRQWSANFAVAELTEGLAMIVICPGFRSYINGTGGSQLGGHIETRLTDLKLLYGAGRNIGCRGAYGFVGDIRAVYLDAGSPAETAAKGD